MTLPLDPCLTDRSPHSIYIEPFRQPLTNPDTERFRKAFVVAAGFSLRPLVHPCDAIIALRKEPVKQGPIRQFTGQSKKNDYHAIQK